MGVSSVVNREVYSGDGTTVSFAFNYYFFNQTDLLAYIYDSSDETITAQTLNTDYTISGTVVNSVYPSGGNLVFGTAPTNTQTVVITRAPSEVQNYSLLNTGQISSLPLVQQFDYLTLLVQRLDDKVSRCIQVPDGLGPSFSPVLPANLTSQLGASLVINNGGDGITLSGSDQNNAQTFGYTTVKTGALTNSLLVFTLPAGALLSYMAVQHSTSFRGTSITDVSVSVGTALNPAQFIQFFDVYQAPGSGVFANELVSFIGDFQSPTNININFTAVGANLSALTQGSLTVYWGYTQLA